MDAKTLYLLYAVEEFSGMVWVNSLTQWSDLNKNINKNTLRSLQLPDLNQTESLWESLDLQFRQRFPP